MNKKLGKTLIVFFVLMPITYLVILNEQRYANNENNLIKMLTEDGYHKDTTGTLIVDGDGYIVGSIIYGYPVTKQVGVAVAIVIRGKICYHREDDGGWYRGERDE